MTKEEFGHISNGMRRELIALAGRFLRATGGPDETEDIVQEALEAELLTLKTERDLTLDEIAKETGRPKQSIKVIISNARRKLREQLKKL